MRCQYYFDALDESTQCNHEVMTGRGFCPDHVDGGGEYSPPGDADEWDDAPPSFADRVRAKVVNTAQLRALPPPQPLIRGLLNLDSLAMLYGPSGAGKSFVAIDLAMTIRSGRQWWFSHEVTTGDVLYVAAEGTPGASLRTTAWETHHGIESPVLWHPGAVSVFDPAWAGGLAEYVGDIKPMLVVIDTFARSLVGADENSTRDVGLAVEHLDMIRRAAGSCVLIVHHAGKDVSKGARGASALKAAMDTEIEVIGSESRLTVKNTKQKDAAEDMPLHLKLTPVAGTESVVLEYGGTVDDTDELPAAAFETLASLREIDMPEGVPASAWKATVSATERTFYRHRSGLLAHGHVVNVGTEKQPRYRPAEVPS